MVTKFRGLVDRVPEFGIRFLLALVIVMQCGPNNATILDLEIFKIS